MLPPRRPSRTTLRFRIGPSRARNHELAWQHTTIQFRTRSGGAQGPRKFGGRNPHVGLLQSSMCGLRRSICKRQFGAPRTDTSSSDMACRRSAAYHSMTSSGFSSKSHTQHRGVGQSVASLPMSLAGTDAQPPLPKTTPLGPLTGLAAGAKLCPKREAKKTASMSRCP